MYVWFEIWACLLSTSLSLDVDVQSPDEKSVITYVSTLYDSFPKVPDGVDGINANVSKHIQAHIQPNLCGFFLHNNNTESTIFEQEWLFIKHKYEAIPSNKDVLHVDL